MTLNRLILLVAGVLALAGCAAPAPVHTLEEQLNHPHAMRPMANGGVAAEIPYHFNVVYANAAWDQLAAPEALAFPDINTQSTLEVPFAIADYFYYDLGTAMTGFALSFGTGDSAKNHLERQFVRGLDLTADANTHYYVFDDREGAATPADVDHAWDQAHKVFEEVYNRDGRCYVNFWTPERGYRGAKVINARGELKQVDFRCPHRIYPEGPDQLITVQAWGNPFDNIRALGAVQSRCWVALPNGQTGYRDYRDCGERLAARQRPYLPKTDLPLMELITTPTAADPTVFEVVARYGERVTVLPAPKLRAEYTEFLASVPYTVED